MKFARHAEIIGVFKSSCVSGGERKVVVTPAAGRQAFKLLMGASVDKIIITLVQMTRIVENRCGVAVFSDGTVDRVKVFVKRDSCECVSVVLVIYVKSTLFHKPLAGFAVTYSLTDNVKENTAGIVFTHDLLGLCGEQVKIGRVEAEKMKMRLFPLLFLLLGVGGEAEKIFGVLFGFLFVETCGYVYGSVNSDFFAGFKLCAE